VQRIVVGIDGMPARGWSDVISTVFPGEASLIATGRAFPAANDSRKAHRSNVRENFHALQSRSLIPNLE
jgi:hypothetical protein